MTGITIDAPRFKRNLNTLRQQITTPLFIILGKSSDVEISNMNSALFLFLFGYEFPETILIITETEFHCITSIKKSVLLNSIKQDTSIIIRQKDNSNGKNIKEQIKNISGKYSLVDKENIKGEFSEFYMEGLDFTDQTDTFLRVFLYKREEEIFRAKKSAQICNNLLEKAVKLVESVQNTNPTHDDLQQKIEEFLNEENDNEKSEFNYPPFLQSGNLIDTSDLYFNNKGNTFVSFDNLVLKIGLRYERMNVELGRTFISSNEKIIQRMKELLSLQEKIINLVNETKEIKKINEKIKEFSILSNTDVFYSTGFNTKEEIIDDLKDGMVIVINLESVIDKKTLILTDTFLTKDNKLNYLTKKSELLIVKAEKKLIGLRTKRREQDIERSLKMAEHQKVLLDKLIEEMINFYKINTNKEEEKLYEKKVYIPYKKESLLPRKNRMFVDKKNEAILVPVFDFCVPFHISLIKNFSKTILDETGTLRINFKTEIKKISLEENVELGTIDQLKSISYTAPVFYIEELANQITDLKKYFSSKEQNQEPIVEQEALLEKTGRKIVLSECSVRTETRTALKNKVGNLEMHENGFKFLEITILLSNIVHIFYLEGSPEEKTILHFHLLNPILVNNKKTTNIQFFKQVTNKTSHDTSKVNDEYTEYLLEQEMEEKSKKINNEFSLFVKEVESAFSIKVEVPYKNKGFFGVPFKENVEINATQECFIFLNEPPYLIIQLNELEIVNFERVILGLRTSDVVFVFKDKKKLPVTIMSVPADSITDLKEFLDSKNVIFLETRVNIQWNNLIKTIMEDPLSFYENNAWYELLNPEMSEESESSTDLDESSIEEISEEEETESGFAEESEESSFVEESEEFSDEEEEEEYEHRKRRK